MVLHGQTGWFGLKIFNNFKDQDWIGFKFFGSGLDLD